MSYSASLLQRAEPMFVLDIKGVANLTNYDIDRFSDSRSACTFQIRNANHANPTSLRLEKALAIFFSSDVKKVPKYGRHITKGSHKRQ